MLALGLCVMPVGVYAFLDDAKVSKIDEELSQIPQVPLGNVTEALGTTLSVAMTKIDRRPLATLEPYVKRLQSRLRSQIKPKLCWEKFVDETGSELVNRSTTMFVDGTELGGSPSRVGHIASEYAMSVSLLRARRHVTALPFAYLTIPLHGAMTALLVFVSEIMSSFNDKLASTAADLESQSAGAAAMVPSLPVFHSNDLTQISVLTMGR